MDLSFIILTWNSEEYIKNCILSLSNKCRAENISFEVIIIDNGSTDLTKNIVHDIKGKKQLPIHLIELQKNGGTTYPRNLGLKKARGEHICILDSDTEFGTGLLKDVIIKLDKEDRIGVIAPKLLLPDGTVQHSVKRFPTFLLKLKKIPKAILGITIEDSDFYDDFPFEDETVVESAISACWIFRKSLIDSIGHLDEKIFYSPEDLDYSIRVYKAGLNVLYFPQLVVLHHTQQITHKKPFSKVSLSHFWGLLYYFQKHGGWFSVKM